MTSFNAEYITYRHMKTQPTIKIELEIPQEAFELMYSVIGQPPKSGESKWVTVSLVETP